MSEGKWFKITKMGEGKCFRITKLFKMSAIFYDPVEVTTVVLNFYTFETISGSTFETISDRSETSVLRIRDPVPF